MRIISGKYKGKKLDGYNINGTRPTMDRVKESLFGMIQSKIKNSVCLDLFAGSGSLGLEAISNGADKCYFVDNNILVIKTLIKSLTTLNSKDGIVLLNDYKKALENFASENKKFDIIFLDPPYRLNLVTDCLKQIRDLNLLNTEGIIICEYENEQIDFNFYKLYKEKKYGTKNIKIYVNSK